MSINLFESEMEELEDVNQSPFFAVLFADGGSRGNPGASAYGYVVYKMDKSQEGIQKDFSKIPSLYFDNLVEGFINSTPFWADGKFIGVATNNQAEWGGLLGGLKWVREMMPKVKMVIMYMDSELVVKQLRGEYKIKNPELAVIAGQVKEVLRSFEGFRIFHIRREKNKLADKFANQKMDENT